MRGPFFYTFRDTDRKLGTDRQSLLGPFLTKREARLGKFGWGVTAVGLSAVALFWAAEAKTCVQGDIKVLSTGIPSIKSSGESIVAAAVVTGMAVGAVGGEIVLGWGVLEAASVALRARRIEQQIDARLDVSRN